MPGKARPSLREKTLNNIKRTNLSETDKNCIIEIFKRYEELVEEMSCRNERITEEIEKNYEDMKEALIESGADSLIILFREYTDEVLETIKGGKIL